ncbi:hypothetical protein D7D52_25365 [Nocardia yunnanensis]|uniref:Uncharacterized protein n=1 Tax=Nocardia yunnanensis TaxID=2382165 RepID=A0A386ZGR6_9NOCA|nr:hypothetical protein [Nocardia yunnanensis]AYF76590.1 hypothetical protein D7D52_25365 [Nocardia yunnanensis]
MTTPSNPTVLDELRSSPIGPYLDTPVTDVLSNLGLPQLPQLPSITLPDLSGLQLPTLPTIDLTSLISPVTSLLQSFGSGISSSGLNPATILTSLVSALTSAVSQSKSATSTVMNSWTGDAATAAQDTSNVVEGQSLQVAAQGTQQHGILLGAQAIVAEGYAEMSALIAQFIAQVSAATALLVTPAGIPWLIETATTTISSGMAIAAKTSAQLAGSTAEIVAAGEKILIAGAPIASNIESLVSMVGTALQPVTSALPTAAADLAQKGASVVSTGVSDISSALSSSNNSNSNTNTDTKTNNKTNQPTVTDTKTDEKKTDSPDTTKTDGGGGTPMSTVFGGVPTSTTPATTLGTSRIPTGEVSSTGSGIPKTTTEVNGRSTATTSPSMGAAGAAGRAGAADEESTSDRSGLVTAAHGDEVIGAIEGVVQPVVGAIEAIEEPPDKALTL